MKSAIPPGTYGQIDITEERGDCNMYCGGTLVMTDRPAPQLAAEPFIRMAYGDVLVAGMGMNIIPLLLAKRECVNTVTIVESNPDVIAVCRRHAWHPKFRSIFKDIWLWTPQQIFDFAYFDIWQHSNPETIAEAQRLQRQFGPWAEWLANWPELQAGVANGGSR